METAHAPPPAPARDDAPEYAGPRCVRGRVLVAESDAASRDAVAAVVEAEGLKVVECTCGSDVIRLAKQYLPDVVFLDVGMRRADVEGILRVLARFDGTRSVVVVLTCPPDSDAARMARLEAAGAMLVLNRPLPREDLARALAWSLAESDRRKRKFEAPARRKPPVTRRVAGNNSLLVRRLLCPFHETPVAVDRYVLRAGKILTDASFFDVPLYKSPVAGADFVDYHLLGVAVCPRCLFASNNPAYFADPSDRKSGDQYDHPAAARAAIAATAGERLIKAGTLPGEFFTHRRGRDGAILSYELAIGAAKTLVLCNPHAMSVELLRLGNYHLRLAHLHTTAGAGPEVLSPHYTAATQWLARAFTVLDGSLLHKTIYQLVALHLSFGQDRAAYQYLTRFNELENAPTRPGDDRGSLDRYLNRCRRAWEDRDMHRFPWATGAGGDASFVSAAA